MAASSLEREEQLANWRREAASPALSQNAALPRRSPGVLFNRSTHRRVESDPHPVFHRP
jgi:hypothetical protein